MSVRTMVVAGNWKMNGDSTSVDELVTGLVTTELNTECSVMVFPPYVHLQQVLDLLQNSDIGVGSQDVDQRVSGAVTGGVSATMVRDLGCSHAIVGHSERRTLFGESDEDVAEKFLRCLEVELTPIVCVGETLEERQAGLTLQVVDRQLEAVLSKVTADEFKGSMVAYEPVWAIGTGESATPEQVEEVHRSLRIALSQKDDVLGTSTSILYGGSVSPGNAAALFALENVDGALVGGAALKADSFLEICRLAG